MIIIHPLFSFCVKPSEKRHVEKNQSETKVLITYKNDIPISNSL